jgi:hypothetical protein
MLETVNYIAKWNGTAFEALGSGVGATVRALDIAPDDVLWVGGEFSTIPGLDWVDRIARWVDDGWAATDLDLPGAPIVYALVTGNHWPDRKRNHDVWAGFNTTGGATTSRAFIFSPTGTTKEYPIIIVRAVGGTVRLGSIKEAYSAKEIIFDYTLQTGDEMTLNLQPDNLSISTEFYGPIPGAVLPSSDLASFPLLPRESHFLSYATGAVAAELFIKWHPAYESID